ncbi:hypothetical protein KIW84_050284 [Lathyrus oleraceus]|uniref:Uncharacterized protein n=1 Tax=Pisum sativum TaxID=3888 RepID=A0A9D5AC86_PEA|nr:hypothetical protein KIW84_050284 [Pisum sativum]
MVHGGRSVRVDGVSATSRRRGWGGWMKSDAGEGSSTKFRVGGDGEEGDLDEQLTTWPAIEGARTSLLGLYAIIFMLIALEIKGNLASIIWEKVIDSSGIRHNHSGQTASASSLPRERFMQCYWAYTIPSFTIKRVAVDEALLVVRSVIYFFLAFSPIHQPI